MGVVKGVAGQAARKRHRACGGNVRNGYSKVVGSSRLEKMRGERGGGMGGRRRGRSNRAYGVVVTFLPHKGGADVLESEKRPAA